jgi:hypothetical protein
LLYFSFEFRKTYIVEVIYCDGRESDTILVSDWIEPNSCCINNYKKAVPEFRGHINVCDIKQLKLMIETLCTYYRKKCAVEELVNLQNVYFNYSFDKFSMIKYISIGKDSANSPNDFQVLFRSIEHNNNTR